MTSFQHAGLAGTADWSAEQQAALSMILSREATRRRVLRDYPTVGDLARSIDPKTVQTPALQVLDAGLEYAYRTPNARLLITVPPQEGKSSRVSVWSILRALQANPDRRVVLVSYAEELARGHSRTARNIIREHGSDARDPITGLPQPDRLGLGLADDKSAASNWRIAGHRGGLFVGGITSGITGHSADMLVIDDPIKGLTEADSKGEREKVIRFWNSVAQTRLSPGAPVIIIQCMTGDTSVRMADGDEKPLREVRVGDRVATWDGGRLGASRVTNWANQGPDDILIVTMRSGRQVRANARHPFLVQREGYTEWVKAGQITSGDRLVALSEAPGKPGSSAPSTGANSTPNARACACPTTASSDGQTATVHHPPIPSHDDEHTFATGTESTPTSTRPDSQRRAASAPSASARNTAAPNTGRTSCASITTTTRAGSEDSYAMTATSWLVGAAQPSDCGPEPTTWTVDEVVSVDPGGVEDVFDIEVERTENFIANGVVSHNTRWHEDDLAGHVLQEDAKLPVTEREWVWINIPAVARPGVPDALNRLERGLPPELESAQGDREWARIERAVGPRVWSALYQGMPTPEKGGLFDVNDFERYRLDAIPDAAPYRLVSIDPAEKGDRDEAGVLALSGTADGRVYLTHDWSGLMQSDEWARAAVLLALRTDAQEVMFEAYTTETTYQRVILQAWRIIRREAQALRAAGGDHAAAAAAVAAWPDAPEDPAARLTELAGLIVPDTDVPPFRIHPHRGKGDKTARAAGTRQAASTGRLRMVGRFPVLEEQAGRWHQGQKDSPDRMDALVHGYERTVSLSGSPAVVAVPGGAQKARARTGSAWSRRTVTARSGA